MSKDEDVSGLQPVAWRHRFDDGRTILSFSPTAAGFPPSHDALYVVPLYTNTQLREAQVRVKKNPDCEEFYNLMQAYRWAKHDPVEEYQAVLAWITSPEHLPPADSSSGSTHS